MNDKDIFNDGYSLPDSGESATSLASSSLRIALKAYFSTYHALGLTAGRCVKLFMNSVSLQSG